MRKRKHTCVSGKKVYQSERQAHMALNRLAVESDRETIPIRCYKCLAGCGGWHLTHREKNDYKTRDSLSFEVTPKSIANRINKLNCRNKMKHKNKGFYPEVTEDDERDILRLYNDNEELSFIEISRQLGLSLEDVKRVIVEHSKIGYGK